MAAADIELMRSAFEALERDGFEAILPFIHPEFETSIPPELSVEPDTYRGHAGIRRYFETFYDAMDEVHLEPIEFVDAGDRLVVEMRVSARGHDTGIEVEQVIGQVWTIHDGLAVRADTYPAMEQALAAVGIRR